MKVEIVVIHTAIADCYASILAGDDRLLDATTNM